MHVVEEIVVHAGEAWWVHLVVAAFSLVDAFFPTVPSESLLVALGSLWATSGKPSLILLILAGWAGAAVGDHVTYQIGRMLPWQKLSFFNEGRRGHRAVEAAERGLEHLPASGSRRIRCSESSRRSYWRSPSRFSLSASSESFTH